MSRIEILRGFICEGGPVGNVGTGVGGGAGGFAF